MTRALGVLARRIPGALRDPAPIILVIAFFQIVVLSPRGTYTATPSPVSLGRGFLLRPSKLTSAYWTYECQGFFALGSTQMNSWVRARHAFTSHFSVGKSKSASKPVRKSYFVYRLFV